MTDFRNASINLKLLSDTRKSFATPLTPSHSQKIGILFYSSAMILYGINGFMIKYTSTLYGSDFSMNSFLLWRSLATIFISLYFIKKNNNEITPLNQIQNLFWLSVRSFGQLVALVSYITAASYLRVGAVSSLTSTSPVVVLILSTIILKEKFYMRYVYGIIVCMIGTLLIISNERGKKHTADEELDSLDRADRFTHILEIIIGVLWGIVNLVVVAMLSVSSKILKKENLGNDVQCYYLGLSNFIVTLLYLFFTIIFDSAPSILFHGLLIFMSVINALSFYIGTYCLIESMKSIDLSTATPLNYLNCVSVFILGAVILKEPVYFTDFLGSIIIIGYNVLNSLYPISDK
jgi:drug/metabolite transporter (DMT)-like permease